MKSYLNLGCGTRFHPEWTNVDFVGSDTSILSHNLLEGIPFPDETFDVVYHSHLLEHLPKSAAPAFLQECHRVLRPLGIHRVAVPDLERIAKVYLAALAQALEGSEHWQKHYEWMTLELLDQLVREQGGGEMQAYLLNPEIPNKDFVLGRIGLEAQNLMNSARPTGAIALRTASTLNLPRLGRGFARGLAHLRKLLLRLAMGKDHEMLELGRFRRGGEVHLWMYDRYSLSELLRAAGFRDPQVVTATESRISGWANYHLDTEPDGGVCKPDSIFVEATK